MKTIILWIFYLFLIFWLESKNRCNELFLFNKLKIPRGIRIEVVVERVFAEPQGEKTHGEGYWVRPQVMQEESSPKWGQDSLWSDEELDQWTVLTVLD